MPDQTPVEIVPTDVRLEFVIPVPKVVADKTEEPLILKTYPLERFVSPAICNFYEGLLSPTPTLPVNSPIERVPLALARIIGIPEISLTENIVPEERLLFIENN